MSKQILAVDDEKSIVRLVQVNLEKVGYQVVTAYDGLEALAKIASEKPDMVICDVMMPYMDGFEVLKTLKKDPATRELPIIMLTARAMDADVFYSQKIGADYYLTKPFSPSELISLVRRIFEGQEKLDEGEQRDSDRVVGGAPVC